MVTAIGYLRVSTDEQHLGPEAQRAAIESWAAREGVHVVAWHVDHGVSGAAPLDRRPGLMAALSELQRGCLLVAAKRCRLARDVVAAATIERLAAKAGAAVATADGVGAGDGPEAALMRTMIDAFAQYERALIRSRTKAALAVKRARGERVGSVPYGYRDNAGRLEPEPGESAIAERIRGLHAAGLSQRAIADALTSEGVPARGTRWHRTTVARVLAA
jgi:DNA invertase Pin-like site-specific DNA recombinase